MSGDRTRGKRTPAASRWPLPVWVLIGCLIGYGVAVAIVHLTGAAKHLAG